MPNDETVNVRYMVDDVDEAIAFYTENLGFELLTSASPAFADVKRGNLRLLLAGPARRICTPPPPPVLMLPSTVMLDPLPSVTNCSPLAVPAKLQLNVTDFPSATAADRTVLVGR